MAAGERVGWPVYVLVALLAVPLLAHCGARAPAVPHNRTVSSRPGAERRAVTARDGSFSYPRDQASCSPVRVPLAREIPVSPVPVRGTLTGGPLSIVSIVHGDASSRRSASIAAATSIPPPLKRQALLQVFLL